MWDTTTIRLLCACFAYRVLRTAAFHTVASHACAKSKLWRGSNSYSTPIRYSSASFRKDASEKQDELESITAKEDINLEFPSSLHNASQDSYRGEPFISNSFAETIIGDNALMTETVNEVLNAAEQAVGSAVLVKCDAEARLRTFPGGVDVHEDTIVSTPSLYFDSPSISVDADETVEAPTLLKIIQFAIPATAVWLCSPLLSLIDTSTVGLLSGTTQQASLNPAVAVTEYSALLISFLYSGTTNLIASAQAKDRGQQSFSRTTRTLVGSLQLSTYVGLGMGLALFSLSSTLVRLILGQGRFDPTVFETAVRYVRIRCLGFPAAAMIGTAQAACLGMQDATSPLYVLLAAAVVNFCGDMLLVGNSNPLIGGAAGAAWATTFSQYAAVGLFIRWLCFKPTRKDEVVTTLSIPPTPPGAAPDTEKLLGQIKRFLQKMVRTSDPSRIQRQLSGQEPTFSTRGFLSGAVRKRDLIKLPSRDIALEFSPYVLPIAFTQLGRVSCFVAMSHVVSSSLGTLAMAAHQVILSFFYCVTPIAYSLGLASQSFIPSIAEGPPNRNRSAALRQTMINLSKIGVLLAVISFAAMSSIPFMSRFSTTDQHVVAIVTRAIPFMAAASLVQPFVLAFEGLLLGRKDLSFVGKLYTAWFFIVPSFMLRLKEAARAGQSVGLESVWKVFFFYNLVRCASWVGRALQIQRKTEKELPHNKLGGDETRRE